MSCDLYRSLTAEETICQPGFPGLTQAPLASLLAARDQILPNSGFGPSGARIVCGAYSCYARGMAAATDGQRRANIAPGSRVLVVQKEDQRTGRLTEGVVREILTKSPTHPHGIKVRLESGEVGRVKEILPP